MPIQNHVFVGRICNNDGNHHQQSLSPDNRSLTEVNSFTKMRLSCRVQTKDFAEDFTDVQMVGAPFYINKKADLKFYVLWRRYQHPRIRYGICLHSMVDIAKDFLAERNTIFQMFIRYYEKSNVHCSRGFNDEFHRKYVANYHSQMVSRPRQLYKGITFELPRNDRVHSMLELFDDRFRSDIILFGLDQGVLLILTFPPQPSSDNNNSSFYEGEKETNMQRICFDNKEPLFALKVVQNVLYMSTKNVIHRISVDKLSHCLENRNCHRKCNLSGSISSQYHDKPNVYRKDSLREKNFISLSLVSLTIGLVLCFASVFLLSLCYRHHGNLQLTASLHTVVKPTTRCC